MDPTFLQTWMPIALGVINFGGWGWAILQSPAKANATAIANLTKALGNLEKRTSSLEEAYKHLPDKESIHRLEINLTQLTGAMSTMGESLKSVREIAIMTRDMIKDAAQ